MKNYDATHDTDQHDYIMAAADAIQNLAPNYHDDITPATLNLLRKAESMGHDDSRNCLKKISDARWSIMGSENENPYPDTLYLRDITTNQYPWQINYIYYIEQYIANTRLKALYLDHCRIGGSRAWFGYSDSHLEVIVGRLKRKWNFNLEYLMLSNIGADNRDCDALCELLDMLPALRYFKYESDVWSMDEEHEKRLLKWGKIAAARAEILTGITKTKTNGFIAEIGIFFEKLPLCKGDQQFGTEWLQKKLFPLMLEQTQKIVGIFEPLEGSTYKRKFSYNKLDLYKFNYKAAKKRLEVLKKSITDHSLIPYTLCFEEITSLFRAFVSDGSNIDIPEWMGKWLYVCEIAAEIAEYIADQELKKVYSASPDNPEDIAPRNTEQYAVLTAPVACPEPKVPEADVYAAAENRLTVVIKNNETNLIPVRPVYSQDAERELTLYRNCFSEYTGTSSGNLSDLAAACRHLYNAIYLGSATAGALSVEVSGNRLLQHELNDASDNEYRTRLALIAPNAQNWSRAQEEMITLLIARRYRTIYQNPVERFYDLLNAFTRIVHAGPDADPVIHQIGMAVEITGFPDVPTEGSLRLDVFRVLGAELAGLDPLGEIFYRVSPEKAEILGINGQYPFRMLGDRSLTEVLLRCGQVSRLQVQDQLKNYLHWAAIYTRRIPCAAGKRGRINIRITESLLSENIICFVDSAGNEIARLFRTGNGFEFKGYGQSFNITVDQPLTGTRYIFDNPRGDIHLNGSFESDAGLYVGVNTAEFNHRKGFIHAVGDFCLEARGTVSRATQEEISAKNILITADLLRELRGTFDAKEQIMLTGVSGVDLKKAHLKAGTYIIIHGQKFMARNGTQIKAGQNCVISIQEETTIAEKVFLEAESVQIASKTLNNYSEKIRGKKIKIFCRNDFINHASGRIQAESNIEIRGGSLWNAGQLKFGDLLNIQLNGFFVNGTSEFSMAGFMAGHDHTHLLGKHVNIVAFGIFNAGALNSVTSLNLVTILPAAGFDITLTGRKQEVAFLPIPGLTFALGTLPNYVARLREIGERIISLYTVFRDGLPTLKPGDKTQASKNNAFIKELLLNTFSSIRWLCQMVAPSIGRPVDMIWSFILCAYNAGALYEAIKKLCNQSEPVEPCDVYPLLAVAAGFGIQCVNTYALYNSPDVWTWDWNAPRAPLNAFSIGMSIAPLVLPYSSSIAPVGLRMGPSLMPIVQTTNILSLSIGEMSAAVSISHQFVWSFEFFSATAAVNVSNVGKYFQRNGWELAYHDYTNVQTQVDTATIRAVSATVLADHLIYTGHKNIKYMFMKTDHVDLNALLSQSGDYKNVVFGVSLTAVTGDNAVLQGTFDLHYTVNIQTETLTLDHVTFHSDRSALFSARNGDIPVLRSDITADNNITMRAESGSLRVDHSNIEANITGDLYAAKDIINTAGHIAAKEHQGVTANGDVINQCTEYPVQGGKKVYEPGIIQGGTGANHKGVGLDVYAGGRIIIDGSYILSIGDINMKAMLAILSFDRTNTYISYYKKWNIPGRGKKETIEYKTQVQQSVIYSSQGKNNFNSVQGTTKLKGTVVAAGQSNNMNAAAPIELSGYVVSTTTVKQTAGPFGLFNSKRTETVERAVPTVVQSGTDFNAVTPSVFSATNALIMGPGAMNVTAESAYFAAPKLNEYVNQYSEGIGFSVPMVDALQNGSAMLGDDLRLFSGSGLDVSSVSALLDTLTDSLHAGSLAAGILDNASTGSNRMMPFKVSLNRQSMTYHGQSVAGNVGIYHRSQNIHAKKVIGFDNAFPDKITGNATLDAPEIYLTGAELVYSKFYKSESVGLAIGINGGVSGSLSVSGYHNSGTVHVRMILDVGGVLTLKGDKLHQIDADILAGSTQGRVGETIVMHRPDTAHTMSWSFSADTMVNLSGRYKHDSNGIGLALNPVSLYGNKGIQKTSRMDFSLLTKKGNIHIPSPSDLYDEYKAVDEHFHHFAERVTEKTRPDISPDEIMMPDNLNDMAFDLEQKVENDLTSAMYGIAADQMIGFITLTDDYDADTTSLLNDMINSGSQSGDNEINPALKFGSSYVKNTVFKKVDEYVPGMGKYLGKKFGLWNAVGDFNARYEAGLGHDKPKTEAFTCAIVGTGAQYAGRAVVRVMIPESNGNVMAGAAIGYASNALGNKAESICYATFSGENPVNVVNEDGTPYRTNFVQRP